MTFIQCPGCGVVTEDSKELCGKCGAALHEQAGPATSPPGAMIDCPSCGAEISFLAKSCPHCGRRIDGSLTARHLLEGAVAKRQAGRPLSLGDKVNRYLVSGRAAHRGGAVHRLHGAGGLQLRRPLRARSRPRASGAASLRR